MATLSQEQFAELSDRGAKHQIRKGIGKCLKWTLMISLSPLAFLLVLLAALFGVFRFLYKVALLFIVVAITTPFLVMYNLSVLVWSRLIHFQKSSPDLYCVSDPRASLGIEIKILVSDFLKQVAGELLLAVSTGIITYFTAPKYAFYVTLIAGVAVVFHTWFNTDCLSRTALSCLCDGYGLSPLMFLFSFIGLFDIGCHPIAKCSFAARKAFLFVEEEPNQSIEKSPREENVTQEDSILRQKDGSMVGQEGEPQRQVLECTDSSPKVIQVPIQTQMSEPKWVELEPSNSPPREFQRPAQTQIGEPQWIQLETPNPLSDERQVPIQTQQTRESQKVISKSFGSPSNVIRMPLVAEPQWIQLEPSNSPPQEFERPAQTRIGEPQWIKLGPSNLPPEKFQMHPQTRIFEPKQVEVQLFDPPRHDHKSPIILPQGPSNQTSKVDQIEVNIKASDKQIIGENYWHKFDEGKIASNQIFIEFLRWNAFERGPFELNPRIDFITKTYGVKFRYILKSSMVLKLFGLNLCKYGVERLELSENYSKPDKLFNFLMTISKEDGFVTDKMRGRYEHSLTLLEIIEGVEKSKGYKTEDPIDERFVVAGCINVQY